MTTCQACRRVVPLVQVKWLYFVEDGEVKSMRLCRECDRRMVDERKSNRRDEQ